MSSRNVAVEYRATEGQIDRLPALAADLVSGRVAVITLAVRAAKNATATIPIVFAIGGDPVKLGLVASFSRPGGNVTGVSAVTNELGPKRLAARPPSRRHHHRGAAEPDQSECAIRR